MPIDEQVKTGFDMTDDEIRQWISACNHEPAKASLRHYLAIRSLSAAEPVKVRELKWRDAPEGVYISKTILADSLVGQYSVTVETGAAYFDGELCGLEGRDSCQRLYDAAIRSALEGA